MKCQCFICKRARAETDKIRKSLKEFKLKEFKMQKLKEEILSHPHTKKEDGMKFKTLQWTTPEDANTTKGKTKRLVADTPFGRFIIQWKPVNGEAKYVSIDHAPWGDCFFPMTSVYDARELCEAEFDRRLRLCTDDPNVPEDGRTTGIGPEAGYRSDGDRANVPVGPDAGEQV